MEKKKYKKKNKKKRDVHKKQQKTLRVDVDKGQAKEQKEMSADADDKEQRRTTRLGAIIAIVAVVGTLCAFLFKMTISALNVWTEQGVIYWYLQVLFSLALSTSIIIFIDIVLYLISDLKRYNTVNPNYKRYDLESDNRYMYLLNDFRIYTTMLFGVFILSIPLSVIYGDESQKWIRILVFCLCALVGSVLIVQWLKHKSKEEFKSIILKVGGKIAEWMFIALFCFTIGAIFIVNNKATINVSYNAGGIVEIHNTSAENYNGLDIEIYNMAGEIVYTESVEKTKLLFAREDKYINNEIDGVKKAEGILINCEWLHWKYMLDLNEIINESGEYYISIIVYQDGKSASLVNSFSVENREYIFAKNRMEKNY